MISASDSRCAVLLAHPGHELVIHGFLERLRPVVAILTDGSGRGGRPRVDSTDRVLESLGAPPASLYARYTDRACYAALLEQNRSFFIAIAEELAALLIHLDIDVVVGDASEGWNPIHDVWRSVIDAAVDLAETRGGRTIENFDFLLFAPHGSAASAPHAIRLDLDEAEYDRKLASGAKYEELHAEVAAAVRGSTRGLVPSPELSAELDRRLDGLDAASYRTEVFRRVERRPLPVADSVEPRVYELYGQMVVAEGRYRETIRHDRHLLPIDIALRKHARAGSTAAAPGALPLNNQQ